MNQLQLKTWRIIKAFLVNASTEERHQYALSSNYDNNAEGIQWLIDNPNTERATILMIYWLLEPKHYYQYKFLSFVPSYDLKNYKLLTLIEERYMGDFYLENKFCVGHELAFDPDEVDNPAREKVPMRREIPAMMFKKISGIAVSEPQGWVEGVPENIWNEIMKLY